MGIPPVDNCMHGQEQDILSLDAGRAIIVFSSN